MSFLSMEQAFFNEHPRPTHKHVPLIYDKPGQPASPRLDISTLESDVQQHLEAGIYHGISMKVHKAGWS